MPLESCTGGHRVSKSSQDSKIVGYNPRKRQEMAEITSLVDACKVVYRGSQGIEILPGPENRGLSPTKTARNCEITSFIDVLELCTRGHKASKAPRDPKIVGYNPRKWPEMAEIASFADDARVMYRGSQGIETLPKSENRGL